MPTEIDRLRNKLSRLKAKNNTFIIGEINGINGIWQRWKAKNG